MIWNLYHTWKLLLQGHFRYTGGASILSFLLHFSGNLFLLCFAKISVGKGLESKPNKQTQKFGSSPTDKVARYSN